MFGGTATSLRRFQPRMQVRLGWQRWRGVTVAIIYVFLWASAYAPSKIAAVESPPLWFLAVRFLTAGIILMALALALRLRFPATLRGWLDASLFGLLANAIYLGCTYTALHRLSAGVGAIVASTNPLVLAIVAPYFLGERLTARKLMGLVMGFGGVIAIVVARSGTQTALPADVALSLAGIVAAVASTIVFKRMRTEHLLVVSAIQLVIAGLAMVPIARLVDGSPHVALTPELIGSFVYLVLVLSVGASLMWLWLLDRGEASRVSAYYYLTPVFGLAISALLLGETIGVHDLFGLGAIVAGIVLVQKA